MIKLTNEGLVTDEAQVAVMFWDGKGVLGQNSLIQERWHSIGDWAQFIYNMIEGNKCGDEYKVLIPYPLVKAAYQPVEGEGYVIDNADFDTWPLSLLTPWFKVGIGERCYHKRVLNIVTTRGELRELVAKCDPDEGIEDA